MMRWPVWAVSAAAMAILSSCAGSDGQASEVQIASGRISCVVLVSYRLFTAEPTSLSRLHKTQQVSG
jgi:hypothetical protein